MLTLNHILNRFGYGRRRRHYERWAGGGLLPILAFFGWRNRARIRQILRDRFNIGSQDPMMRGEGI